MTNYPKHILTLEQQLQSYKDSGMEISSDDTVQNALLNIGYYRLRGYCYTKYDHSAKKYCIGTRFDDILSLYHFDVELSHLLFSFLSKIEVTLRVRLTESLLTVYGDPLVLNDPTPFIDKNRYWKNHSSICSEISRSTDEFIKHNFHKHDGQIPLWACVEILSFGTVSRIIKNLKPGPASAFSELADQYPYQTTKGRLSKPSQKMFTSWLQALVVLRNACAHNSRIYNRTFNTRPEILKSDTITPTPVYCRLYQLVLAMKYLSPTHTDWQVFVTALEALFHQYQSIIQLSAIGFPPDWKQHLS